MTMHLAVTERQIKFMAEENKWVRLLTQKADNFSYVTYLTPMGILVCLRYHDDKLDAIRQTQNVGW